MEEKHHDVENAARCFSVIWLRAPSSGACLGGFYSHFSKYWKSLASADEAVCALTSHFAIGKELFLLFFLFKKRSWNYREMHRKRRWSLFFFAPSRSSDAIKRDKSELQWRNKGQECAAVQFEMFCSRSAVHGKWSSCVWFTYFLSVQMNDGPLCKCSAKARRTGIRHSIYPGEEVWHAVNKSPFHNLAHRGKDVSLLFSVRWPFFPFVLEGQTDCVIHKEPNDDATTVRMREESWSVPVTPE